MSGRSGRTRGRGRARGRGGGGPATTGTSPAGRGRGGGGSATTGTSPAGRGRGGRGSNTTGTSRGGRGQGGGGPTTTGTSRRPNTNAAPPPAAEEEDPLRSALRRSSRRAAPRTNNTVRYVPAKRNEDLPAAAPAVDAVANDEDDDVVSSSSTTPSSSVAGGGGGGGGGNTTGTVRRGRGRGRGRSTSGTTRSVKPPVAEVEDDDSAFTSTSTSNAPTRRTQAPSGGTATLQSGNGRAAAASTHNDNSVQEDDRSTARWSHAEDDGVEDGSFEEEEDRNQDVGGRIEDDGVEDDFADEVVVGRNSMESAISNITSHGDGEDGGGQSDEGDDIGGQLDQGDDITSHGDEDGEEDTASGTGFMTSLSASGTGFSTSAWRRIQQMSRDELIQQLVNERKKSTRLDQENDRLCDLRENPLYKEELNGREEDDIRDVFEKIMARYENGTTRRNHRHPSFFQYDYDAVSLVSIKEAFGVHSRYHALHLPKVVAIGLVRNLYDFGLFCKLEKMDHWKRIKQSNTFLCLQSAKIGENAAATNSGLIDPQGHRHPASCLCSNNGMSQETAATVIMVVLDIAGFADFTINADGTDNGRRLRNSRGKESWLTINPADPDECVDRQILTEDDCWQMYSDYENRPNLTWAGKDDGEGDGEDGGDDDDSDSDNGQN